MLLFSFRFVDCCETKRRVEKNNKLSLRKIKIKASLAVVHKWCWRLNGMSWIFLFKLNGHQDIKGRFQRNLWRNPFSKLNCKNYCNFSQVSVAFYDKMMMMSAAECINNKLQVECQGYSWKCLFKGLFAPNCLGWIFFDILFDHLMFFLLI